MGFTHRVAKPQGRLLGAACESPCGWDVERWQVEQRRFDSRETVITGPLFGPKMKRPAAEAADREQRLLDELNLRVDNFQRYSKLTRGGRRPNLVWPQDLSIQPAEDGLRFQVTLPRGVYATMLMREFQKLSPNIYDFLVNLNQSHDQSIKKNLLYILYKYMFILRINTIYCSTKDDILTIWLCC